MKLTPPTVEEFSPYYADYIQRAKARGDVMAALPRQADELNALLGKLTDKQARFKFGPAEWSIKELVGHLNDVERVFSYRLLRVSRNDKAPLTGFEQDDYVREAGFDNHDLKDLLKEFELLRGANVIAINNLSEEATKRIGTASGNPVSARALIHMLVGHVDHHVSSLQQNYLPGIS
jgi:hypothetical protein